MPFWSKTEARKIRYYTELNSLRYPLLARVHEVPLAVSILFEGFLAEISPFLAEIFPFLKRLLGERLLGLMTHGTAYLLPAYHLGYDFDLQ